MSHSITIPQLDTDNASPDQLRKYAEILRFKLEEVIPNDNDITALQIHYNLTKQQALILASLSNGRLWTRSMLTSVATEDAGPQIVKVQISHLRQKLPKSIEITTQWGVGYHITRGVDELRKVIAGTSILKFTETDK